MIAFRMNMDNIRKILVPTDFSDFSTAALEYAIALSVPSRATIYVIHVMEGSGKMNAGKRSAALTRMQEYLNRNVSEYMFLRPVVCAGVPDREIVRFARQNDIDLIVIATHGRTGFAHVVMGSVAEKLVRHSEIPVLTVKPRVVVERILAEGKVEHQVM